MARVRVASPPPRHRRGRSWRAGCRRWPAGRRPRHLRPRCYRRCRAGPGERGGDRLAHRQAGEVGEDALGQRAELDLAGGDEADQRVLHGGEGLGRRRLGRGRRVGRGVDIVLQRAAHAVLPVAALAQEAVLRSRQLALGASPARGCRSPGRWHRPGAGRSAARRWPRSPRSGCGSPRPAAGPPRGAAPPRAAPRPRPRAPASPGRGHRPAARPRPAVPRWRHRTVATAPGRRSAAARRRR